jgi:hypothetical protein
MSWMEQSTTNGRPARISARGVASGGRNRHLPAMTRPPRSPLDEPRNSAHAWRRYRRLMAGMGLLTVVVIVVALCVLYALGALVTIHVVIATILGIGVTMMLMAALMGLVFLSSGTGHDEAIEDRLNDGR